MCMSCDKTKEPIFVFWGRIPPDIQAITIKEKTIEELHLPSCWV